MTLSTGSTGSTGSIIEEFDAVLERRGDAPAIDWLGARPTSAAELRAMIHGLANDLRRRGVAPGDRVLIEVPSGELFVSAVMASQWIGAVPVLVDPSLGPALSRACIAMAKPAFNIVHPLIVGMDRVPGALAMLRRWEIDLPAMPDKSVTNIVLTTNRLRSLSQKSAQKSAQKYPAPPPLHPVDPLGDNLIVFTGGTTQTPKGVRMGNAAVGAWIRNIEAMISDVRPFESFLADTPQQVLFALCLGRRVMTTKGRKARRAKHVFNAIMSGKVEAYFSSPFIWRFMMEAHRGQVKTLPSTLKTVLLGSATVSRPFLEELSGWLDPSTEVRCIYGLTEAGVVCTTSLKEKLATDKDGDFVGSPLPGMEVRIDDPDEEGRGAVVVYGPSLYTGYLGQPDRPSTEGLVTGDIARLDTGEDGRKQLVLLGRSKDMVIRESLNIYPQTMEPFVLSLKDKRGRPLFTECALVGMWNKEANDGYVVLATRPNPEAEPWTESAIRGKLREVLGAMTEPDVILEFDAFSVTGRQNKIDKHALRMACLERLDGDAIAPYPPGQIYQNRGH